MASARQACAAVKSPLTRRWQPWTLIVTLATEAPCCPSVGVAPPRCRPTCGTVWSACPSCGPPWQARRTGTVTATATSLVGGPGPGGSRDAEAVHSVAVAPGSGSAVHRRVLRVEALDVLHDVDLAHPGPAPDVAAVRRAEHPGSCIRTETARRPPVGDRKSSRRVSIRPDVQPPEASRRARMVSTPPPWEAFAVLSVASTSARADVSGGSACAGNPCPIRCRSGRPRGTEDFDMNKSIRYTRTGRPRSSRLWVRQC